MGLIREHKTVDADKEELNLFYEAEKELEKKKNMKEYIKKNKAEEYNCISVWFYNEDDKVMAIGDKMKAINNNAYMNGYNWSAFFDYYLTKHYPEIQQAMDENPEAGSYVANFEMNPENELLADKFIEIITHLIENEEELYTIIKDEGDQIEWD